jgi:spermidine/putrescine transport system ATP-binding protein
MASENDRCLEVTNLYKAFGDVVVLNGVSMTANRGDFISLVGPSGCGKTTTLNIIAGFEQPDRGDVLLDGRSMLAVPSHRRQLGMVFQNHALFPHMTIAENVGFGLAMRRKPRSEIAKNVDQALDMVRLTGFGSRYPRELSGGQQQRVGIARALTVNPRVILMDEPLSSLDAKLRREMQVELRRIQKDVAITAIYVTHDQEEALSLSDRIILMNKGQIEQAGTPEELYSRPVSEFAAGFIGESSFLNATVAVAGAEALVTLDQDTQQLPVPGTPELRAGDRITLAVRPDRVRITAGKPQANCLSGVVTARAFVGPVQRFVVRLPNGSDVSAQCEAGAADLPAVGEAAVLAVNKADWLTFSPAKASE